MGGPSRAAARATPPPARWRTFFKRYLYHNYCTFASITHYFSRRITVAGWVVVGGTVAAAALGADTNQSRSYQTFAFLACLALVAAVCAPFGRPNVSVQRILPKFGSAGEAFRYRLIVRSQTRRRQCDLILIDEVADPAPTFEEFLLTPEPGEERRNWIDRAYGYYRWRWLMGRQLRAQTAEQTVPDLPPGRSALSPRN